MTTKEKIEIMQHSADGGKIEIQDGDAWVLMSQEPNWNWEEQNYRIYEEPKPKETVTIEKWLYKYGKTKFIVEIINIDEYIKEFGGEKIELLDTYEVTIPCGL